MNNAFGGATAAHGQIGFGSGVTDENLWFQQSGNNVVIDLLGTNDSITVQNWFSGGGAQVQSINAGSETLLNTQVAQDGRGQGLLCIGEQRLQPDHGDIDANRPHASECNRC